MNKDNFNNEIEKTQHQFDGILHEIIVNKKGEGKASIRATATIVGVDESSLRTAFNSVFLVPSKLAQFLLDKGIAPGMIINFAHDGIPDFVINLIAQYYSFHAGRYCTTQAQMALSAFSTYGIRKWMQDLTGYHKKLQKELEKNRVGERLKVNDVELRYQRCCRKFIKTKGKGCNFNIAQATNMVYELIIGMKAHELEQKYPLTYWALKRDVFQEIPLQTINRLLSRFVVEMEAANYNFKSILMCMKMTLMCYEMERPFDILEELLIPDWEINLLRQIKLENPNFDYDALKKWVAEGNDVRKFPDINNRIIESQYKSEIVEIDEDEIIGIDEDEDIEIDEE